MTFVAIIEIICLGFAYSLIKIFINGELVIENSIIKKILSSINFLDKEEAIRELSIILFFLYLFKFIFQIWVYHIQFRYIYDLKASIASSLFKKYLSQNFSFFVNKNSSELIRNIREEVGLFSIGVMQSLTTIFTELILVIGVLAFLLIVSMKTTLIAVIFFLVISIVYFVVIKNSFLELGQKRQKLSFVNLKRATEMIQGIKDIKIYNSERYYFKIFDNLNFQMSSIFKKIAVLNQLPRLGFEVLLISLVVLLILNMRTLGFNTDRSLEVIGLFALAAFRILPSASKILVSFQQIRIHLPSINVLKNEFNLPKIIDIIKLPEKKFLFEKLIKIENLTFKYDEAKKNVINDLSLEIKKNDIIGIIGASGSGKSTFLNLLVGLLVSPQGSIKIDNENIDLNSKCWQKKIGYISQNVHIIDDTLKNNILFGSEIVSEKKILNVLRIVRMDSFVKNSSEGLETVLGEMGSKISGGQAQRLSIARCLYRDPEIIILDEGTSALDEKTENEILDIFDKELVNKTIIIVSHRKNTMKICDKIYHMEDGQLKLK